MGWALHLYLSCSCPASPSAYAPQNISRVTCPFLPCQIDLPVIAPPRSHPPGLRRNESFHVWPPGSSPFLGHAMGGLGSWEDRQAILRPDGGPSDPSTQSSWWGRERCSPTQLPSEGQDRDRGLKVVMGLSSNSVTASHPKTTLSYAGSRTSGWGAFARQWHTLIQQMSGVQGFHKKGISVKGMMVENRSNRSIQGAYLRVPGTSHTL